VARQRQAADPSPVAQLLGAAGPLPLSISAIIAAMIRGPAMRALLPLLLLLAFLNGCGFKGPLYLPEEKSAPASRDAAPRQE